MNNKTSLIEATSIYDNMTMDAIFNARSVLGKAASITIDYYDVLAADKAAQHCFVIQEIDINRGMDEPEIIALLKLVSRITMLFTDFKIKGEEGE
jgi:hypothetical protein